MAFTDPALTAHLSWLRLRRLSEDTIRLRTVAMGSVGLHAGKPLLEVTAADLDRWDEALGSAGGGRRGTGGLSDSSRATYIHQVRTFYAWAVAHEHLEKDPSGRLMAPKLARPKPRPISEADLRMAVLSAPARIRPWLELAGWAGFRAREISLLTRDAIRDDLPEPIVYADGKGRRERAVPLAPRVWAALVEHGLPDESYVFPRLDGELGPIPPYVVSRLCSEHLHGIGVPCTLHQLRHRFLTQIYRSTKDIRMVQELAGHSSPTTSSIYADFDHDACVAAVSRLGALSA